MTSTDSTTNAPHWPAPVAHAPIKALVSVPGSKSLTNRALILAAIADGPSILRRPLHARDTMLMAQAMRSLGLGGEDLDIEEDAPIRGWKVIPQPLRGDADIDCGLAGTVMRFVPPLAALAEGDVRFDGDERARERPMGPMLEALRTLGVDVEGDALPFTVKGKGRVRGGRVELDASSSSQFVSALLLVGSRFDDGVEIVSTHEVPSMAHVEMTIAMLKTAGITVEHPNKTTWRVAPGQPKALNQVIEPDLSNALPFVAAALVTQGSVTIRDWPNHSLQPDFAIRELVRTLGGRVTDDEAGVTFSGGRIIHGADLDMSRIAEVTPTVAALAALADSPTQIRGVAHLRGHETDRLAALVAEINGLGGDVRETADGLHIEPKPLHAGVFHTYADHRMATAGAILGLRVPGIEVENIGTTDKTLPNFPELWTRMLEGEPA